MELNTPTQVTGNIYTVIVPITNTVDVNALTQEKTNNLAEIEAIQTSSQQQIDDLTARNTDIDTAIALGATIGVSPS